MAAQREWGQISIVIPEGEFAAWGQISIVINAAGFGPAVRIEI